MPELPEVETSRRTVERVLKGKVITHVRPDSDDRIVYDRQSPEQFRKALEGARVMGTGRKGKYFWLELDRKPWPVFHLGMTGNVLVRRPSRNNFSKAWGGLKLWSEGKPDPDGRSLFFCRLLMTAEDGTEIAITDPRRFGRIRLARDPLNEPPISKLGYDPLHSFPSAKELSGILGKRRIAIKAALLDQSVFAGIGNWMADEILFQSRISPHRMASRLSAPEVARLRSKLLAIVRRAVADKADYDRYPVTWLFHNRWGKEKDAMTSAGRRIIHDVIGGRTAAWVPAVQK